MLRSCSKLQFYFQVIKSHLQLSLFHNPFSSNFFNNPLGTQREDFYPNYMNFHQKIFNNNTAKAKGDKNMSLSESLYSMRLDHLRTQSQYSKWCFDSYTIESTLFTTFTTWQGKIEFYVHSVRRLGEKERECAFELWTERLWFERWSNIHRIYYLTVDESDESEKFKWKLIALTSSLH